MEENRALTLITEEINRACLKSLSNVNDELKQVINYNQNLAKKWQPGTPSRSSEAEKEESHYMISGIKEWLNLKLKSKNSLKICIIDLGGGNGKMFPLLQEISNMKNIEVHSLYFDLSDEIISQAKINLRKYPDILPNVIFFRANLISLKIPELAWKKLNEIYDVTISCCLGGTFGNIGSKNDLAFNAISRVFRNFFEKTHLGFITFLNQEKLQIATNDYLSYGVSTKEFDSIKIFGIKQEKKWLLEDISRPDHIITKYNNQYDFFQIEMFKNGKEIGQTVRYFDIHVLQRQIDIEHIKVLNLNSFNRYQTGFFQAKKRIFFI